VQFYDKLGFTVGEERAGIATMVKLHDFWIELLLASKVISEEYQEDISVKPKGAGSYLQVQVENIDDFYDRAQSNGIQIPQKPENYPWKHREITIVDPDGYKITFFSPA